jgi:tetratricopeptide (TPR) repeat protein
MRAHRIFLAIGGRAETAGAAVVILAALFLAAALGGAHVAGILALSPVFLAGTLILRPSLQRHGVPWPALLAFVLSAYTCVQAFPLPLSLVEVLNPSAWDVWSRALLPLAERPAWASLSLDPGASSIEALKWALYGCSFIAASTIARRSGAVTCAAIVFALAFVVALLSLAHVLIGARRVFGIYTPEAPIALVHIGPLLNPNTLAGYLNLGGFCGLGLALSRALRTYRWPIVVCTVVIFGVSILSGSRAGVALIAVGVGVLLFLRRPASGTDPGARNSWLQLGLVFLVLLVGSLLAVAAGRTAMLDELRERDFRKLELIPASFPLIREHAWFGIGRGAFESVFSAYKIGSQNRVFSHPENLVVQWLSEWGVPVGMAALVAFGLAFRPRRLRISSSAAGAGAATGVLVLVLQNLVDLSLELPAVGVLLAFALTATLRSGLSAVKFGRWTGPLLVAAGVSIWVAALAFGRNPVAEDRKAVARTLRELNASNVEQLRSLREQLRAAMLRHPAEPYFARAGALAALRARDSDPMPWLQRALERGANSSRSHLLTAYALMDRGAAGQALFELKTAMEIEPELADQAGRVAAAWTRSCDRLLRAAPGGASGAVFLTVAASSWVSPADAAARETCLNAAVTRDPGYAPARRALAEHLLKLLNSGLCSQTADCERRALEHADALDRLNRGSADGIEMRAKILSSLGRNEEAKQALRKVCPRFIGQERLRCLKQRFQLARDADNESRGELLSVADELIDAACFGEGPCDKLLIEVGDGLASAGEWLHALAAYQRASRENPSGITLLRFADALAHLKRYAHADEALARALRMAGGDPLLRQRIQRKREAVTRLRAGHGADVP